MANNISVFDFDGTIANSIPISITILKRFARSDFNRKIDDKLVEELRDKPIPEIFKALKVPIIKLPLIASKARKELNKEVANLKPIKGMRDTLIKLKKRGQILGIVSSNSRESILKFLEANDLEIFDFIYTNSRVFGKSSSLKKVVKENKENKGDIVYFGDELRDIEAAKKVGIKIVSVTWGVNSREKLIDYKPNFLVDEPKEIIDLFETKSL